MDGIYVAVDIGATNVRVASGDMKGLGSKISERTDRGCGPEGISKQIIRMIKELSIEKVAAVGVGTIGPIDAHTGSIRNTPNFPYRDIPIVTPLRKTFRVPVSMFNDCSAAVLGEQAYGAGTGIDNLVYITLSTGLGGGAIVDRTLLTGKDGNAVEVGHLTINPDSPMVCGCGCRGHWEAYSSGVNIPTYARFLLRGVKITGPLGKMTAGDPSKFTPENLFEAAKRGDQHAMYVVRKVGEVNAVVFANIVNVFDPKLITIGGSIAIKNSELVLRPIIENIRHYTINRIPEIMITPMGDEAVLLGALTIARSLA